MSDSLKNLLHKGERALQNGDTLVALLQLDRAVELKDELVGQKTIPLAGNASLGFDKE